MQVSKTRMDGLYTVDVIVHGDDRGYFFENYRESDFEALGFKYHWVQENQSLSKKGVLRGMGFQKNYPQAKLIRVLDGKIYDVVVDLRAESNTYRQWMGFDLSAENKRQLLIPRGFAHGFLVLSEYATITYKCDNYYHPEDEGGFIWNDETINIQWPKVEELTVSEKDSLLPSFEELGFGF